MSGGRNGADTARLGEGPADAEATSMVAELVMLSAEATSVLAGLASPAAGNGSIPAVVGRRGVRGGSVGVSGVER